MDCTIIDLPVTGIPSIDQNHQRLDAFIARLNEVLGVAGDVPIDGSLLGELADYFQCELPREEELLSVTAYPDLAAHQADHRRAQFLLQGYLATHGAGVPVPCATVMAFIRFWHEDHILGLDLSAAEYLRMKPEQPGV